MHWSGTDDNIRAVFKMHTAPTMTCRSPFLSFARVSNISCLLLGIQSDEEGPDLFVHWSNLQCKEDVYKTLSDDEVVEFDIDSKETSPGK